MFCTPVSLVPSRWDGNEVMPEMSMLVDSLGTTHDGHTKGVKRGAEVAVPGGKSPGHDFTCN